jgi:predicted transcriptional regulator
LECALAHMGLDLALATLAKEQPLGYDKIGKRAKPKGELYFVHCMLKAIGYNGRRSVETRINAWREEATATVQKDYSPRKLAAGLRVVQGIARLATQCGKLNLSMSTRELATETGLAPMTVSKHLKELRGLNVIKRGFIEEGKEGYAYEYNLQSVGKMDTLGGAGGCCRGCTVSLHFGEDEKNGFGGSSQKWFVYEAILQLVAGNGSTTVREVVNVLGLDPKRGRDSVARHVRDLRKAGLITREGHVLKRGDTSPREYAAARGTSERMKNRRERYEADRDSYWKFWRVKKGLSEEETRAKFPPIRIAKPRTASTPARTLTPYTVEIETPQEPTERRILVTVGTRRNE